ncbi:MAG: hypothetical protein ABR949_13995 [Candidatus Aquilonibacter sp.]|jgi:hypothetical protein
MNDESRALRHQLRDLCDVYNVLVADKDTLDYRLGSHEAYAVTTEPVDAESVYEGESHSLSADLRDTIVKMIDVAQRIRKIEHF